MSDLLPLFDQALTDFSARVAAVANWTAAVPGSTWTAADLVDHVVEEHLFVPPLMNGLDVRTASDIVAGTSDRGDAVRNWDVASVASRRAFFAPDALDRSVELSRGPTPAGQYLSELVFDLVVHGWDLGRTVPGSPTPPEVLVDFAYAVAQDMGDLSETDAFADPKPVDEAAPTLTKLLALTGRDSS